MVGQGIEHVQHVGPPSVGEPLDPSGEGAGEGRVVCRLRQPVVPARSREEPLGTFRHRLSDCMAGERSEEVVVVEDDHVERLRIGELRVVCNDALDRCRIGAIAKQLKDDLTDFE